MKRPTCDRCGHPLLLAWVGGAIPWWACPVCDLPRKES